MMIGFVWHERSQRESIRGIVIQVSLHVLIFARRKGVDP
jgi:hypothetical protein